MHSIQKIIMLLGKGCVSQHRFLKNARAISCAEWWIMTLPEHVHVFSARDAMSSAHYRTMLCTHLHTICGLSWRFVSQVPPLQMYTQCPARNRGRERVRDVDMWCLLGTQCHSQGRRRNMRTVLCPQLWIRTCFAHVSAGHGMCFTKSPFHSVHITPCTKSKLISEDVLTVVVFWLYVKFTPGILIRKEVTGEMPHGFAAHCSPTPFFQGHLTHHRPRFSY